MGLNNSIQSESHYAQACSNFLTAEIEEIYGGPIENSEYPVDYEALQKVASVVESILNLRCEDDVFGLGRGTEYGLTQAFNSVGLIARSVESLLKEEGLSEKFITYLRNKDEDPDDIDYYQERAEESYQQSRHDFGTYIENQFEADIKFRTQMIFEEVNEDTHRYKGVNAEQEETKYLEAMTKMRDSYNYLRRKPTNN